MVWAIASFYRRHLSIDALIVKSRYKAATDGYNRKQAYCETRVDELIHHSEEVIDSMVERLAAQLPTRVTGVGECCSRYTCLHHEGSLVTAASKRGDTM